MPKLDKRSLRACILEPVEREVENPLPGVPVHFNYGIFFNDNYDYMKHLKSVAEFEGSTTLRITGIPEEDILKTAPSAPSSSLSREPELDPDDHLTDEELRLDSDAEADIEEEVLEDDFIEQAGGHKMTNSDTDDLDAEGQLTSKDRKTGLKSLREEKVMMMERFLYGDNERKEDDEEFSDAEVEFLDEATRENRNFEKLIHKCRQQRSSQSASQSCVTGTSMMSEGLQFALSRDSITLLERKPKTDDLDELDRELKLRTITFGKEQLQAIDDGDDHWDSSGDDSPIVERLDVMSIQSEETAKKPINRCLLAVPTSGRSRRSNKKEPQNDLEDNQPDPSVTVAPQAVATYRRQGESKEEKKLRKTIIKEARRDRRQIRKANQCAFREERKHQIKTVVAPIH